MGVGHNLPLVVLELRLQGFLEGHRLGGDHMHERAPLHTWEDGFVNGLGVLFGGEDHASPWSPQGLVGCGGNEIRIGNRAGMHPRGHETRNVGHVHHEQGAGLIGDFPENLEVDDAGVGGSTGDDHFGPVLEGQIPHLVVVDPLIFFPHTVVDHLKPGPRLVHGAAVGEVSTVA